MSRATRFPRILWIGASVEWPERLTSEDRVSTERAHARWLANATLEANRATSVRPCPAVERLFALMDGGGKVEADAWTPSQFNPWWRP